MPMVGEGWVKREAEVHQVTGINTCIETGKEKQAEQRLE